jgi:hypothetical protein
MSLGEHLADHVAEDRHELGGPAPGVNDDLLVVGDECRRIVDEQLLF